MDVKLLEAFRAVVDHRSMTAAAGAMGVTQPAVSTQIARLEETVGFPLFERANGRLKPTAEGVLFYAEASRVLGEVDRLQAATAQIREGQSGRLVIASHPSAAISLLPNLVAKFLARAAGRVGAADLAPFRRGEPAPAQRKLRHRHRRTADRREPGRGPALRDALRRDPAAAPSARVAQAADAATARAASDGDAGALASGAQPHPRRLLGGRRVRSMPWSRPSSSPASAVWWRRAPAGRSSIRCRRAASSISGW